MGILKEHGWKKYRTKPKIAYRKGDVFIVRSNGIAKDSRCAEAHPYLLTEPPTYIAVHTNCTLLGRTKRLRDLLMSLKLRGLL